MADRKPLISGNWKMHHTHLDAIQVVQKLSYALRDEDYDSVGGLLAKHLGKVPIPGSSVEVAGLRFTAEEAKGRRNKIGTVLIAPVASADAVEEAELPEEVAALRPE